MATATAEAVPRLSVGDGITDYSQYRDLPIGSLIGPDTRRTYKKVDRTVWENTSDGSMTHYTALSIRGNRVQALPVEDVRLMSLRQWQFLFLDHIWYSGEIAGTGDRVIYDAQAALNLPDEQFPIGAGIKVKSSHFRSRLPQGTIAYLGEPENLSRFGVFRLDRGSWTHLIGDQANANGGALTVLSVPDGTVAEWATAPGTEEEQEAISAFKARAWRVGWKAKVHHRWCSTYESYLAQIGLTAEVLRESTHNGISTGDRVDPIQASMLPPNSVLRWRKGDGSDWAWFVRDNDQDNRGKLRRLFGMPDGSQRNYASTMEVLWINNANEPWSIPLTVTETECLPPGARIEIDGAIYRIARDQTIGYDGHIAERGSWTASQFNPQMMRLVSMS